MDNNTQEMEEEQEHLYGDDEGDYDHEEETTASGMPQHDDHNETGSVVSLAATENELLVQVRSGLYVILGTVGVLTAIAVLCAQRHLGFHYMDQAFQDLIPKSSDFAQRWESLEILVEELTLLPDWPQETWTLLPSHLDVTYSNALLLLPVVNGAVRKEYEEYTVEHEGDWLQGLSTHATAEARSLLGAMSPHVFNGNGTVKPGLTTAPLWQTTPAQKEIEKWVNFDAMSSALPLQRVLDSKKAVLSAPLFPSSSSSSMVETILAGKSSEKDLPSSEPVVCILYPVLDPANTSGVLAIVVSALKWNFPDELDVFVESTCAKNLSYAGSDEGPPVYQGITKPRRSRPQATFNFIAEKFTENIDVDYCNYSLTFFPSSALKDQYMTWGPFVYVIVILALMGFVVFIFGCYDELVEERQKVVMEHATQADVILASLFPQQVRERLFRRNSENGPDPSDGEPEAPMLGSVEGGIEPASAHRIKSFLTKDTNFVNTSDGERPIADLFPHCTVLFADISGFTAWSSLRDPSQVFRLLEAIYSAFDSIARRRGVFKVETIGDSYVAVTGLPDPQPDHALIMARFARDCRARFKEVTAKLELSLGPDTGDLCMRFGLHSGQVTAGVLRGEKSRFQLFGDTVNVAARMESTGERDRIQVSQSTADLLVDAGKGQWLRARVTMVQAKGKGHLQTFWLEPSSRSASMVGSLPAEDGGKSSKKHLGESALWGVRSEISDVELQMNKHQRLIDYTVDLLSTHLKKVMAQRKVVQTSTRRGSQLHGPKLDEGALSTDTSTVLDEVVPVIRLPQFDAKAFKSTVDPDSINLGPEVQGQLKRYVSLVAAMYRQNPFHNWEHASHVTMSVTKLLSRVVTPEIKVRRGSLLERNGKDVKKQVASDLHNYTHGITSDPLTQLAIIFAAMIHDLDHYGISNGKNKQPAADKSQFLHSTWVVQGQLVKEKSSIAEKYRNKSVAEQNSVDMAWDLLMDTDEYGALQSAIFPTHSEFKRFRQVVVNVVMATDIFDKELQELRRDRWDKAFSEGNSAEDEDYVNRKATIVIEHIMQASDVAHTMQHWHVYQKWNRRLFDEMYTAYRGGRMEVDPSTFWYKGELKFFDGYIIPLAKKLKECNVFGVASQECLNYALDNRNEWESKGEMIVTELLSSFQSREDEEAGREKKKNKFMRRRSLITTGG